MQESDSLLIWTIHLIPDYNFLEISSFKILSIKVTTYQSNAIQPNAVSDFASCL